MDALDELGLANSVYLWSDDNLSNDYFWRYLTARQRTRIARYRNYGKVGCFKGFDSGSFSFNTAAEPSRFDLQFELFQRYIEAEIDIYAYVTITHASSESIRDPIRRFVDRLQQIDPMLPLRTVPLEISQFGPVTSRLDDVRRRALAVGQYEALEAWLRELETRFTTDQRSLPITEVKWSKR